MKILVTGHSGSGKSTTAKEMASRYGLELVAVDDYMDWKELGRLSKLGMPGSHEVYREMCKGACDRLFELYRESNGVVIEGAMFFMLDLERLRRWVAAGWGIRIVNPPRHIVIQQRARREFGISLEAGKHPQMSFEQLWLRKIKTSTELYEEHSGSFKKFMGWINEGYLQT